MGKIRFCDRCQKNKNENELRMVNIGSKVNEELCNDCINDFKTDFMHPAHVEGQDYWYQGRLIKGEDK